MPKDADRKLDHGSSLDTTQSITLHLTDLVARKKRK
jgi:hypothetical protein